MKFVLVVLLGLLGAACTLAPPRPFAGGDPADPETMVPPAQHRSALQSYKSQRPVEPAPWRQRNDGVAPGKQP